MLILTIKTDQPEARIELLRDGTLLEEYTWQAHRALAETLHAKINELLQKNSLSLDELGQVVVFQGPGSFTGLRIGISVANAIAYALDIPVTGLVEGHWAKRIDRKDEKSMTFQSPVVPIYGADPHITQQKK